MGQVIFLLVIPTHITVSQFGFKLLTILNILPD